MPRILLFVVFVLLSVGCADSDNPVSNDLVADSTPIVAIPVDADWELIATLQRNPLKPAEFYIFPHQNEAINAAYRLGKHFIFEFGREIKERNVNRIRHYIIQPEPPFQDKDKDALQLKHEEGTGGKFDVHFYTFLSEGWYEPVANALGVGGEAIGLGVQFDLSTLDDIAIGHTEIGLIGRLDSPTIGRGRSFIHESTRLRIYVSR